MASNHLHESATAEFDPFESLLTVEEKNREKGLKEGEDIEVKNKKYL